MPFKTKRFKSVDDQSVPAFVAVETSAERGIMNLTIGSDSVRCNALTALRLYESLKQHFGMWGDKPNRADCREIRRTLEERAKSEAVLAEFMQRDAAQENPYSSPLTRDIPFGQVR